MTGDFSNYTHPVARKIHRCEWCGQIIPVGEKHVHHRGVWDGGFQDWRMHNECYKYGQKNDEISEGFAPFENHRPALREEQEHKDA